MRVSDVMTRTLIGVPPDMPLRDVARLLHEHRISGVPVIDEGACIGVVSEGDLVAKQAGRPASRRVPLHWIFGEQDDREQLRRRAATTAREAMSSPPITIADDRPLREAAALMVNRGVSRLPVTRAGRVVGIVTRSDLVAAYLRFDADVLRAVREDVLRGTMWLDPDTVGVAVHEGVVSLSGTVDRRSTARIIERLTGLVDGVSDVVSTLHWELDDHGLPTGAAAAREPGAASVARREELHPLHG